MVKWQQNCYIQNHPIYFTIYDYNTKCGHQNGRKDEERKRERERDIDRKREDERGSGRHSNGKR